MLFADARQDPFERFTVEHVEMLNIADSSPQRLAHRLSLAVLAALCILGAAVMMRPPAHCNHVTHVIRAAGKRLRKLAGCLLLGAAVLVPLFDLPGTVFPGPGGWRLSLCFLLASMCMLILGLPSIWTSKSRPFAIGVWVCITVYGLFLTLPGLYRPYVLPDQLLSSTEWHYSVTLAQGDRIAAGLELGPHVLPNYGLIHALALAVFERNWGFLDFAGHIRLVQISQIAFLLGAIWAFRLWKPNQPWFALFGLLLIGPWLSTSHLSVYHPNQAGWRNFGLAAGIVLLLVARRQLINRAAFLLGAGAVFLWLYNPETGSCLAVGYGLFLLSRQRDITPKNIFKPGLWALSGALLAALAAVIAYRVGIGTWPSVSPEVLLGFISKFSEGYGGLIVYFDPLALLIFVHSVYLAASLILRWRTRDLQPDESVRLSIAATILLWSAYYMNRPHAWNLWTFQFLYVFLISGVFEARYFVQHGAHRLAAFLGPRQAALAFVLLPMLFFSNYSILRATSYAQRLPGPAASISGISVTEASAHRLRAQAEFLARQEAGTLFFSLNSYSLSLLTQRFNPLSTQDAFAETITKMEFDRLVNQIRELSPRLILFDAPIHGSLLTSSRTGRFYARFFDRLKRRLADRYNEGPTMSGWQIWQLRSDHGS
jgi:hypothetical protein